MLNYYRYKLDNNMMELEDVPQPYQDMLLKEGYTYTTSEPTA